MQTLLEKAKTFDEIRQIHEKLIPRPVKGVKLENWAEKWAEFEKLLPRLGNLLIGIPPLPPGQ